MTISSDFQTLLSLGSMGIPLYSARGLRQTLTPIQAVGANIQRDINGDLVDLRDVTDFSFCKYSSRIECGDADTRSPLEFDGIWPGQVLTVDCVCELGYSGTPSRAVVTDSTRTDADGNTFYRPQLQMMITGWSTQESEWEGTVAWSLDLEEQ